jgi:non-heme chloroperoxidase
MKHPRAVVVAIVGCVLLAVPADPQTPTWTDTSGHRVTFVTVAPEVNLEVLDWGGVGPPLILLTGIGNTAHVYDHFAHQFTDRYHVVGITRRGFGASSHPADGYDIGTRAQDTLAVMDALGFDSAILVGHSIAGDELTKFAGTYPARARAVVYLDAAYDRTKVQPALPQPNQPTTDHDFESVENWNAVFARETNARTPESEIYNTRFVGPDGHILDRKTPDDIPAQMIKQLEPPEYTKVRAPALALYARPELRYVFPNYPTFDAESKKRARHLITVTRPYQNAAIRQFTARVANGRTAMIEGSHYVFLTNESEVVRLIRGFLKEVVS